jgi:ankyrin repeat protein
MNINNFPSRLFSSKAGRIAMVSLIMLACNIPAFCDEIHEAARDGDIQKVNSLLKKNPELIASRNSLGQTPLYSAAGNNNKEMMRLLLAKGADVNDKDNQGSVPLGIAAMMGCKDAAELLLSNGAEINVKNNKDAAPLHVAASAGWKDLVEFLLSKGAEINSKDGNGNTPLHLAVQLLDKYREDASPPVFSGITVMIETLQVSNRTKKELLELLLAKGADVNAMNNQGQTPLRLAVAKGHKDVVESLRQHGGHE